MSPSTPDSTADSPGGHDEGIAEQPLVLPKAHHLTLWILLAAVLLLGATVAYRSLRKRPASGPSYQTSAVDRGAITAKVTATGTLSAITTVEVGAQVSGRIQDLEVDFNSPVRRGQVLAHIDPRLFRAGVEQAKANYAAATGSLLAARAQAENALAQFRRAADLYRAQLLSPQDYDAASAASKAAQAQVAALEGSLAQAAAALHQAELNLEYTTIVSPIDGIVISRNVDMGQTVAAAFQAPTLFTVAEDLRKMQVDTSVAESDVGQLREHMPASFTVDAYPGVTFTGTVRQVRNAPQTIQNVVTYDVVIDVENRDLRLKPGMTANASFVYASKDDVVRISNAALRFRPPDGLAGAAPPSGTATVPAGADAERPVWVLRGGAPVQVRIRTGITDGSHTEIVGASLRPGDQVILDVSGAAAAPRGFRLL